MVLGRDMRAKAMLLVFLITTSFLSGCFGEDEPAPKPEPEVEEDVRFWVTDKFGNDTGITPLDLDFQISVVGEDGPEPSLGITSSGCVFFIAMEKPMRSCDGGQTWVNTHDITQAPFTSDPYGWVDPDTDRVFNIPMMGLESTWIGWSDNDGESWMGNPHDSGPLPLNDHIKLATGPWVDGLYGGIGQLSPVYDNAVYFCFNKLVGVYCYTSFDGGATFEVGGQLHGLASTNGGLHGAISTAPDGTVYVTPRVATPTIIFSKDNGLSWEERTMGSDAGTPDPRKNSEVATDTDSNAYHVWTGNDQGIYMSRSIDSGESWEQESIRVSPAGVISTAFPHAFAGDPGRIAFAYLGSENASELGESDLDGNPWNGNGHYATGKVHYHMYITYSLNALDENPTFHTMRVTDDPVQIGSMCLNSGDCRTEEGGSNRNLLDFNDLHIDKEGRVYIAYADGCINDCATNPDAMPENSRSKMGTMVYLRQGPSLYDGMAELQPLY